MPANNPAEWGHHRRRAAIQAGLVTGTPDTLEARVEWLIELAEIQGELIKVLLPNVGNMDYDKIRELNRRLIDHYTDMPFGTM